jgi:hypothetical protein
MPRYRMVGRRADSVKVDDLRAVRPEESGGQSVETEYGSVAVPPVQAVEVEQTPPDFDGMKKDELVALAEERGIDSSGNKPDIIARLKGS